MKNILVLGDSFSYGEGCSDRPKYEAALNRTPSEYSWVSLLRNELYDIDPLGYDLINLSKSGNSLMGMYRDLLLYTAFHADKLDMLIFSITSFNRLLVADAWKPDDTTNWVLNGAERYSDDDPLREYNKAKTLFIKYLYNDITFDLHGLSVTNAILHYAKTNNIKCLFSMPRIPEVYKNPALTSYLEDFNFTHLYGYDYSNKKDSRFNKTCVTDDGHPNDLGHSIYYDNIVKPKVLQYIKDNL